MMPFSPEFLKELKSKVVEPKTETKTSNSNSNSKPTSRTPSSTNLVTQNEGGSHNTIYSMKFNDYHVLIGLDEKHSDLFVSGFGTVEVLKGNIMINGYSINTNSPVQKINCPIWQPAYIIQTCNKSEGNSMKSNSNRTLQDFLVAHNYKDIIDHKGTTRQPYKQDLFSEFSVIISLRGIDIKSQEWLITAEDQSMYCTDNNMNTVSSSNTVTVYTTPTMIFNETIITKASSIMLGSFTGMAQSRADCMSLPSSWSSACYSVVNRFNENKEVRAVVCGSKGVGKSTCLRYLANRLLSATGTYFDPRSITSTTKEHINDCISQYAQYPAICILDCDLGQPELTCPGSVSLHIITDHHQQASHPSGAFLTPSYMNIRKPDTSYFLGDLTSKNEPTLVLEYINRLIVRYEEIVKEVSILQANQHKLATQKFIKKNTFNALMLDNSSSSSESEGEGETGNHMEYKNSSSNSATATTGTITTGGQSKLPPPIPLIVNLDGYIKNMGAEVLEGVLGMLRPTHALHICSDRDRGGVSLEGILGIQTTPAEDNINDTATTTTNSTTNSTSTKNKTSTTTPTTTTPTATTTTTIVPTLLHLEPGRIYSTPRVAAVDLRVLRLVSYFLPSDTTTFLIETSQSRGLNSSTTGSNSSKNLQGLSRSNSTEKIKTISTTISTTSTDCINENSSVNSEVLVRNGAIIDLQGQIALKFLSQTPYTVPFSKLILCMLPYSTDLPLRLFLSAINASIVGIQVLPDDFNTDTTSLLSKRLRYEGSEFDISIALEVPILPCAGLGVVRAVDIANQSLYLSTPLAEDILTKKNSRICLIKGNNMPVPTCIVYSPLLPCFPYMSNESSGEGSAQLRTRNNVKRRAQQIS